MKTIAMTMKSIALAAMMMTALMASAATTPNGKAGNHPTIIISGRGHTPTVMAPPPPPPTRHEACPCNCRDCKKIHKALDKHMRKHHTGKQNRMACRTCMEYSHILNTAHHTPQPHHHR